MIKKTTITLIIIAVIVSKVISQVVTLPANRFLLPHENPLYTYELSDCHNLPPLAPYTKGITAYLNKTFSVRFNSNAWDVLEDSGGYHIAGYTNNMTGNPYDSINHPLLYRLKMNKNGTVIWYYVDSLANGMHGTCYNVLTKLSDSNLLMTGFLYNDYQNPKNYDTKLPIYIKYDTDGTILWQRLIADTSGRRFGFWPMDVIANDDGGFTAVGLEGSQTRTWDPDFQFWYHDTTYITIIQYDSNGYEEHRKQHFAGGEPRSVGVNSILRLNNGGYAVTGHNFYNFAGSPLRKHFVIRLDSNFNFIEIKKFGQMISELYVKTCIIPAQHGGYWFGINRADTPLTYYPYKTFYTYYYQIGLMDNDFNIIKDTMFRIFENRFPDITKKYYAGIIQKIVETDHGEIVGVSCYHASSGRLFSLDTNLTLRWTNLLWDFTKTWGKEWIFNMRNASDGGFLVTGMSTAGGGVKGWIVKTDSTGCMLPGCADTAYYFNVNSLYNNSDKITIYPNPSSDKVFFTVKEQNRSIGQATLYTLQGQLIFQQYPRSSSGSFSVKNLDNGIYILRMITDKGDVITYRVLKN